MKIRVQTDSQIKIAYHWRKFKVAKDKRKAQEIALEAEKLAKKGKKKAKGGAPTKSKFGSKSNTPG